MRSNRLVWLAAFCLLLSLVAVRPRGANPDSAGTQVPSDDIPTYVAIVGVNVIPMDGGGVLADQTVLIRGGRVAALGSRVSIDVPASASIVQGAGRWLIPGLFDMHVHLRQPRLEPHLLLYLANGVTTVQSMNGSPWHLKVRSELADGSLLGPRLFTTGPTTATEGVSSPEAARDLVAEQKRAGYDAIKQYGDGQGTMDRETYTALAQAARQHGMRLVGHAPRSLPFSAVLEGRQTSIDHMEEVVYTSREIGELFRPYLDIQFGRTPVDDPSAVDDLPDLDELQPATERLSVAVKEAGLAVTPTLIAFDRIQAMTTDEIYRLAQSRPINYIDPATRVSWRPAFNSYRSGGWADKLELMARILESSHRLQMRLTGAFHAAGVPIMSGTDAPLPYVFPGFTLHEELKLLVESGLSPYEALRAATVVPAGALGIEDAAGTVAVGVRADLVLLEANPLENIEHTSRIAGVATAGRWLSRTWIDSTLASIEAEYAPILERIEPMVTALEAGDAVEALKRYRAIGDTTLASFIERTVNTQGYRKLRAGDLDGALRTFRLNTEYFPDAWNTWDSLAEAYMTLGDDEKAIQYYEKSLELNPDNRNARRMLERIRSRQESG